MRDELLQSAVPIAFAPSGPILLSNEIEFNYITKHHITFYIHNLGPMKWEMN